MHLCTRLLDEPVRKDEAAREAPREPGVPPHVGRHSREAELAVLQRELAIAVEVGNSRVLAYLRSDQLRDAPENRLHSAARGQPRAGGPCPVPTLRCACMRCAGGCLHADPGHGVREERTRARVTLMGYADMSYVDTSYADDTSYDAGVGGLPAAAPSSPSRRAARLPRTRGGTVRREAERRGQRGGAARTEQGRARALRGAVIARCGVGAELLGKRGVRAERCRPVAGRVRYGCTAGAHQQRPDC